MSAREAGGESARVEEDDESYQKRMDALEAASISKELDWLMNTEFPREQQRVTETVKTCLGIISVSKMPRLDHELDLDTPGYIPLFVQQRSVSGYLVQLGGVIARADIQVKLNKVHGKHDAGLRVQIQPEAPYVLHQLRDAFNYMRQAYVLLHSLKEVVNLHSSWRAVVKVVQNALESLVASKHCLQSPSGYLFPKKALTHINDAFEPELPHEVLIEMTVNQNDLVMRVLGFATPHKSALAKMGLSFDSSSDRGSVDFGDSLDSTTSEAFLEELDAKSQRDKGTGGNGSGNGGDAGGSSSSSSSSGNSSGGSGGARETAGGIQKDVNVLVSAEHYVGRVVDYEGTAVEVVDGVTFRYPLEPLKEFLKGCEDCILTCSLLLRKLELVGEIAGVGQ